ncbi:MAG: bifunctional demethylmenaquinone methyltransferase/2-methoxy-6-polyprenyl-1,4-benzoquinol methylase UbiE [Flavobacteriaceae bacterium]
MAEKVTPYKDSELGKKEQVAQMFDTISSGYDGLNRVISLGADVKWRKRLVETLMLEKPKNVLDIATGTGDLAIAIAKRGVPHVVGLDISSGMLEVGKKKIAQHQLDDQVDMVLGDGENLPFDTDSFDAITVAFGVRNFENLEKGLQEILRVLRPNGLFLVLETSVPTKFPFKQGYHLYCDYLLPLIGKLFSKDRSAYGYLSQSAAVFPHGAAFNNILSKIGFKSIENRPQTFGAASIYLAKK